MQREQQTALRVVVQGAHRLRREAPRPRLILPALPRLPNGADQDEKSDPEHHGHPTPDQFFALLSRQSKLRRVELALVRAFLTPRGPVENRLGERVVIDLEAALVRIVAR